ncbi:hypothetical protein OQA88_3226 [Cercophora sp. LCS_1]
MGGPAARPSSPPAAPAITNHRFFTRQKRNRANLEHIGRSNAIQSFFEGPEWKVDDEKWVEHAPPSLPQAKKNKQEGAAVQIYKRRNLNLGHEGFYIYKVRLQSPYLRDALKETLETYGITWNKNDLFADSLTPHRGLFFALDKVAEIAKTADDETTRSHCELLCSVIEEIFDDDFDKLEELEKQDKITFKLLWTLFPEKSIYVIPYDGFPPRAYRVKSVVQTDDAIAVRVERIIFDGFRYGTAEYLDEAWRFEGAVPRHSIPGLRYLSLAKNPDLRALLIERGRMALEMQTIRYMKTPDEQANNRTWLKGEDHQRVIVDPYLFGERRGFQRITPLPGYNIKENEEAEEKEKGRKKEKHDDGDGDGGDSYEVTTRYKGGFVAPGGIARSNTGGRRPGRRGGWGQGSDREASRRPTEAEIELNRRVVLESEDNLLLMPWLAFGYSLDQRTWQSFNIHTLTPVEADKSVFEKVVLDEQKKDVLKTLVEGHMELTARYDDLITGKGQCLLVILSGPPGTGKTLVAESLAEHLGCPLLRADPTSIQPDTFRVVQGYDATLAQFLKDATEWGSLVLFDEPDFLFQNQESSTDRKDLLAFLRQAEYFKGIIFLTTNLGRTIDPAVLSRAQIHITFPSLTEHHRVRVWNNFIERVPEDVGSLSPSDVARLATWRVNGREIKNILNMAVSWYRKKGEFSVNSIETLIKTICPSARREENAGENASSGDSLSDELVLLDL